MSAIAHVNVSVSDIKGVGAFDAPMTAVVNLVLGMVNGGVNEMIDGLNITRSTALSAYDDVRADAIILWHYVRYIEKLLLIEAKGVWTYLSNVLYQLFGPNSPLALTFDACIIALAVIMVVVSMGVLGGIWQIVRIFI